MTVPELAPLNTILVLMLGLVSVGLLDSTTDELVLPVDVVTPVPPFATATVPVTFAALPLMFPLIAVPGILVEAVAALVPLPYT